MKSWKPLYRPNSQILNVDLRDLEATIQAAETDAPVDRHAQKAAEIFDVPLNEVTAPMRRVGKQANYLELYSTKAKVFC